MIVPVLFALVALQTKQTNNDQWASLILHSAKAQKYARDAKSLKAPLPTNLPQPSQGPAGSASSSNPSTGAQPKPGGTSLNRFMLPYDGRDEGWWQAWQKEGQQLRAKAREIIKSGDRAGALDFLKDAYVNHPYGDIGAFIVDLDLELGRNKDAYRDLMCYDQYADITALPRLSLVAALNGQVEPGQAQFVRNSVIHHSMYEEQGERLPIGGSPQEVVALSYLALAEELVPTDYEAAIFYEQEAVRLDPGDPTPLAALSAAYLEAGRLLDAEQAAEEALAEIHSPKWRSYETLMVQDCVRIVKKFGNVGKPIFELK